MITILILIFFIATICSGNCDGVWPFRRPYTANFSTDDHVTYCIISLYKSFGRQVYSHFFVLEKHLFEDLYGVLPVSYDQDLALPGQSIIQSRYHFSISSDLYPSWESQCFKQLKPLRS